MNQKTAFSIRVPRNRIPESGQWCCNGAEAPADLTQSAAEDKWLTGWSPGPIFHGSPHCATAAPHTRSPPFTPIPAAHPFHPEAMGKEFASASETVVARTMTYINCVDLNDVSLVRKPVRPSSESWRPLGTPATCAKQQVQQRALHLLRVQGMCQF